MALRVEWNPEKERSNRIKHGVSFEEAASVFLDPLSLTIPDPDHSKGEFRFVDLGKGVTGRLLVVSCCDRSGRIRIISARTASPKEIRQYENGFS